VYLLFVKSNTILSHAVCTGASEFTFGGTLAHFNTTPDLPSLDVPVLLTSGTYDTMRPPVVEALYRSIPKVEWIIFQHSGHVSMIDDAGLMNDAVDDFLNRVEVAYWSRTEFVPNNQACGLPGCKSKYERHFTPSLHVDHATRFSIDNSWQRWIGCVISFISGTFVTFIVTQILARVNASKAAYRPL
jgi:hypothetical protein